MRGGKDEPSGVYPPGDYTGRYAVAVCFSDDECRSQHCGGHVVCRFVGTLLLSVSPLRDMATAQAIVVFSVVRTNLRTSLRAGWAFLFCVVGERPSPSDWGCYWRWDAGEANSSIISPMCPLSQKLVRASRRSTCLAMTRRWPTQLVLLHKT